ncbi:MAG: hypothetical protein ACI87C_001138 [Paraperlucidibaca sp.]|jgi:hypothetical protein
MGADADALDLGVEVATCWLRVRTACCRAGSIRRRGTRLESEQSLLWRRFAEGGQRVGALHEAEYFLCTAFICQAFNCA